MRKSTAILSVIAIAFASSAFYFAVKARDIEEADALTRKALEEQRAANREVHDLRTKIGIENSKFKALSVSYENAKKECAAAIEGSAEKSKALAEADKKIAGLIRDSAQKESALQGSREDAEKDKGVIAALEKKLAEEHERAETLNGEVIELRNTPDRKDFDARLAEKDRHIQEISKERSRIDQELAAKKFELASALSTIEKYQNAEKSKSENATINASETEKKLAEARERIAELERQIQNLHRRLANR